MTTTVEIKANHGWPVRVTQKHPETGEVIWTQRVKAGATLSTCVHSTADMHIHEIQPGEPDFDEPVDQAPPEAYTPAEG